MADKQSNKFKESKSSRAKRLSALKKPTLMLTLRALQTGAGTRAAAA